LLRSINGNGGNIAARLVHVQRVIQAKASVAVCN